MEELFTSLGHWAHRAFNAQRFVWLVNAAAALLLAVGLAQWTWKLIRPPLPAPQPQFTADDIVVPASAVDLDRLLSRELFGRSPTPEESAGSAPVTSLNLVLMGVVAAGGESLALISVDGRDQLPFAIGEEIAHGAVLDAVYPDRVIILRQGVRESLILQEIVSSLPLSSITRESPAPPAASAGDIKKINDNLYRIDRNMLQSQLNSPSLLSQALIVPHTKGGFEVRNVAKDSLYQRAGLRNGDVIKKVNGQQINTLDDAMRVYRQMGGIDRLVAVNVDIERQGSRQRIHYQLR
jgi:general secretion pathway protein C